MKEIKCPITHATHILDYDATGNGTLIRRKGKSLIAKYDVMYDQTFIAEAGDWVKFADRDELDRAFLTGYYYVYSLIHPETQIPFYIGKGFQNRAVQHFVSGVESSEVYEEIDDETKTGMLSLLLSQGYKLKDIIRVVARSLDEKSAFDIESLLIHHCYPQAQLKNVQSGHFKSNFRPYGSWSYIESFDLILTDNGHFKALPESYSDKYYIYVLVDPTQNDEPFYIGKGKGLRLQDHFNDALRESNKSPKLDTIRNLFAKGYRPADLGKVIAYTESPVSSFMMESFYLKFVVGNTTAISNEVLGHYQQNFRARGDWALRKGFDLRIVVEKGAPRDDLRETFLGLELDLILEKVKHNLEPTLTKYKLSLTEPVVADAGELSVYASIRDEFKLKIFVRPSRNINVEIRPTKKNKRYTTEAFIVDKLGASNVLRGDGVFLPNKPTPDCHDAAKRARLMIELLHVDSVEQLTAEMRHLLLPRKQS